MGRVIYLDERRSERRRAAASGGRAFFFDVADPLSYLAAERVERLLGEVEWVPVAGAALRDEPSLSVDARGPSEAFDAAGRTHVDACARALRLPLVWPDRFPAAAPRALRACAYAGELGAGSAFALAASRLAFCGGFDLEDPETLTEAAAAAGVPLDGCMEAANETWRDEALADAARVLRAHGIRRLPAVRVDGRWLSGEAGLLLTCDWPRHEPVAAVRGRPPAPVS